MNSLNENIKLKEGEELKISLSEGEEIIIMVR